MLQSLHANLIKKRKVIASMTSEYVSSKSIPSQKPCATNGALCLMIYLLSLCFRTNTHLYPTGFTPLSVWTVGPKTSCLINKFNYAYVASFHFGKSFLCRYSSTFCGSGSSIFLMMSKATWKAKILLITT